MNHDTNLTATGLLAYVNGLANAARKMLADNPQDGWAQGVADAVRLIEAQMTDPAHGLDAIGREAVYIESRRQSLDTYTVTDHLF